MTLSDLASLGSFVSGLAVLASLIYLTLQIRQAERYQRAIVQQGRAARLVDTNMRAAADPEFLESVAKGANGDDDISLTQFRQYVTNVIAGLYNLEDTLLQHKAGLISDDVFDALRSSMKRDLASQAGWRAMWKLIRFRCGKEVREFVDQLLVETPLTGPRDVLAVWKTAVAAERTALQTDLYRAAQGLARHR